MAIRKILTMDQPVLRAKAKKVSRFDNYLERLVNDMWETMREAPGVGLAAPQIGEAIRVLVAEYEDNAVAFVNPEIIKRSDEMEYGTEGCLSIPGLVGDDVPRHAAITVKGRDPKGKEIRVKAEGWFARVLQHEIDHLDGVLYIDHIPPEKVRKVEPDEIADEAEVHHTNVKETVAGASEPIRRATPASVSAANANSGKNGNPNSSSQSEDVGAQPAAPAGRPRGQNANSGKNGNRDAAKTSQNGKNGNRSTSPRPVGEGPGVRSNSGKNGNSSASPSPRTERSRGEVPLSSTEGERA